MREIKFRVWDSSESKMLSWEDMNSHSDIWNLDYWFEDNNLILMQYTGLKDKNGKECYFNDFVKLKNDDRIYQVVQDDFGIPLFTDFNAGMDINFSDYFIGMNRRANDFEIIGNIYENSELLESEVGK